MQGRAVMVRLGATPLLPAGQGRIEAIDLARGVAIALMILSHAVSGLLGIRQVPDWGMVHIALQADNGEATVLVRDTGPGVQPEPGLGARVRVRPDRGARGDRASRRARDYCAGPHASGWDGP